MKILYKSSLVESKKLVNISDNNWVLYTNLGTYIYNFLVAKVIQEATVSCHEIEKNISLKHLLALRRKWGVGGPTERAVEGGALLAMTQTDF